MAAAFAIRTFRYADTDAVVELWRTVFHDDAPRNDPIEILRSKLGAGPEQILVGESDRRVVATVLFGWDGHRGWIYHLAVDPRERRRGFGRRIMEEAERRLRALGCPKVNLQVRADNAGVVAFYERLGFSVEDRVSLGKVL